MLEIGAEFLVAINKTARTDCGFATVDNVLTGVRADRMESFYIAEEEFETQVAKFELKSPFCYFFQLQKDAEIFILAL